jgi:hypothetical protein
MVALMCAYLSSSARPLLYARCCSASPCPTKLGKPSFQAMWMRSCVVKWLHISGYRKIVQMFQYPFYLALAFLMVRRYVMFDGIYYMSVWISANSVSNVVHSSRIHTPFVEIKMVREENAACVAAVSKSMSVYRPESPRYPEDRVYDHKPCFTWTDALRFLGDLPARQDASFEPLPRSSSDRALIEPHSLIPYRITNSE